MVLSYLAKLITHLYSRKISQPLRLLVRLELALSHSTTTSQRWVEVLLKELLLKLSINPECG
jgi:hypothetical protein